MHILTRIQFETPSIDPVTLFTMPANLGLSSQTVCSLKQLSPVGCFPTEKNQAPPNYTLEFGQCFRNLLNDKNVPKINLINFQKYE